MPVGLVPSLLSSFVEPDGETKLVNNKLKMYVLTVVLLHLAGKGLFSFVRSLLVAKRFHDADEVGTAFSSDEDSSYTISFVCFEELDAASTYKRY